MIRASFRECQTKLFQIAAENKGQFALQKKLFDQWLYDHDWTPDEFLDESMRIYKQLTGEEWPPGSKKNEEIN